LVHIDNNKKKEELNVAVAEGWFEMIEFYHRQEFIWFDG